eukprot:30798_1
MNSSDIKEELISEDNAPHNGDNVEHTAYVQPIQTAENTETNMTVDDTNIENSSTQGLIPENWLLQLYSLADDCRKKHSKLECAIYDLKSQLAVDDILAEVVATDVLNEIETVDPYLDVENKENDTQTNICFNLDELKLLNNNIKFAVFGFIRMNEKLLLNHNKHHYYIIPPLIIQLILYYYHYSQPKEYEPPLYSCKCSKHRDKKKQLSHTINTPKTSKLQFPNFNAADFL